MTVNLPATGRPCRGSVVSYDADRGLGVITDTVEGWAEQASPGAARTYRFHCTAIADGSRAISAGSTVMFVVVPGLSGEMEGRQLTSLAEPRRRD